MTLNLTDRRHSRSSPAASGAKIGVILCHYLQHQVIIMISQKYNAALILKIINSKLVDPWPRVSRQQKKLLYFVIDCKAIKALDKQPNNPCQQI